MKLVYLGSPEPAVAPLRALVAAGHEVVLVVSRADARRGRGGKLSPSPVKSAAVELGLATTDRPDDVLEAVEQGAELGVVVAYGRLIRAHLLEAMPFVNLHFSLLPRWRGAAPVERAVLAGDTETGVCLMALEEGLDTGPVHRRVVTAIDDEEPVSDLRDRLVALGTDLLIGGLRDGLGRPEPQTGEPTYAKKLDPVEFELDFEKPALELRRLIRLGVAWTTFRSKRFKVLEADVVETAVFAATFDADGVTIGCGSGALRLRRVQPEGKSPMEAQQWRNGAQPRRGERLG